jgi:hypothetical protein
VGNRFDLSYAAVLDAYTLQEILELNDKTEEDCLEFLHEEKFITLPDILPIEYD